MDSTEPPVAPGSAAVLGKPVSHSLSPVLHRAAYKALGLSGWRYEAIECDEDALAGVVAAAGPDVVGYSCTMPIKRRTLEVATAASAEAAAIGAANTLLRVEEHWFADNTDWIGIRDALSHAEVEVGYEAVILGAGGTAQAALAALVNVERVTVLLRDPSRADALLATAERLDRPVEIVPLYPAGGTDAGRLTDEALAALRAAELVISTLPPRAADRIADATADFARSAQVLLDVVYDQWPTALAHRHGSAGGRVLSGASMLLYQAVRQVELMTGRAAPVPAMQAALLAAAPSCGLSEVRPPA